MKTLLFMVTMVMLFTSVAWGATSWQLVQIRNGAEKVYGTYSNVNDCQARVATLEGGLAEARKRNPNVASDLSYFCRQVQASTKQPSYNKPVQAPGAFALVIRELATSRTVATVAIYQTLAQCKQAQDYYDATYGNLLSSRGQMALCQGASR